LLKLKNCEINGDKLVLQKQKKQYGGTAQESPFFNILAPLQPKMGAGIAQSV
jgi:hypothetical protein